MNGVIFRFRNIYESKMIGHTGRSRLLEYILVKVIHILGNDKFRFRDY